MKAWTGYKTLRKHQSITIISAVSDKTIPCIKDPAKNFTQEINVLKLAASHAFTQTVLFLSDVKVCLFAFSGGHVSKDTTLDGCLYCRHRVSGSLGNSRRGPQSPKSCGMPHPPVQSFHRITEFWS